MSAEGPQEPTHNWEKVRLLKTNDGTLWYRTKTGEAIILDEAAEDELSRQNNEPDTPPADGYPEFSKRIGAEELPLTDPSAIEQKRTDLETLVNNLVDIDTDLRTSLMEEIVGAEDDGDLEAIKTGIDQLLKDKRDAARAAGGAAAGGAGAAGKTPQEMYDEAKQKFKEKHAKKRAETRAERDAIAELDAEEAAAKPQKTLDEIAKETKDSTKERHAKKRAISKAEREAIAELDAEEAAARPPETPKTPDEILADLQKAETERIERRELEELAKKNAKDALEAAKNQKQAAEAAAQFAREKAHYEARYDNLRRHGIIDDTTSILAEGEVAQATSIEELARFDGELKGLEARLPENPVPDETTNEITSNAEFAQLTAEAIGNLEAIMAVGGNPGPIYERYRKRFRAGNLRYFDVALQRREAQTGKKFGIDYGSMTPAERMRYQNPPPKFADSYTANGRIDRAWQVHSTEKYGDLVPFSIDDIRNDPKKKALYDRFLKAVEYDNTLMKTVEEGKPLDAAQRKLLEYSQYEFTNQFKRAEVLSEMFTPEFTKKLMYQNEFVNSMAVMYGVDKTAAFMKDDVFRIAMEDLGTFDRLANAALRLKNLGASKRNAMRRGEEQFEMANIFEERLRDEDLQKAMEKESMTGTKSVENLPPPKEMSDEFSAANLQKYFDRDKMKAMIGDRGWDKWTDAERKDFKRRWEPEEIREKRKNKEAGFYAQLKAVIMEAFFGEQKKQVSAH